MIAVILIDVSAQKELDKIFNAQPKKNVEG